MDAKTIEPRMDAKKVQIRTADDQSWANLTQREDADINSREKAQKAQKREPRIHTNEREQNLAQRNTKPIPQKITKDAKVEP